MPDVDRQGDVADAPWWHDTCFKEADLTFRNALMISFAALLLSLPVHALSCLPAGLDGTLPDRGAVDVPLNVLPTIAMHGYEPLEITELSLWDGDGQQVETEAVVVSMGDPVVVQLEPAEELEANQEYIIRMQEYPPEGAVHESRFTTGSDIDLEPPSAARITEVAHEESLGGEWGDDYHNIVRIRGAGDPSGTMFRIELSDNRGFSNPDERIRLQRRAYISTAACINDEVATLDATQMWVRVTPIDAAGNEGPSSVVAPQSGCTHVSGMQLGWLGIVVGLIGALRRSDAAV